MHLSFLPCIPACTKREEASKSLWSLDILGHGEIPTSETKMKTTAYA
jgi:hypothetical protein